VYTLWLRSHMFHHRQVAREGSPLHTSSPLLNLLQVAGNILMISQLERQDNTRRKARPRRWPQRGFEALVSYYGRWTVFLPWAFSLKDNQVGKIETSIGLTSGTSLYPSTPSPTARKGGVRAHAGSEVASGGSPPWFARLLRAPSEWRQDEPSSGKYI
jgi:hypothetical protein